MLRITLLLFTVGCGAALAANGPCDLPRYCTPSQVFGCMNSIDFGSSYYKEAIDDIIKLVEPYVYLDILKNPPQPEGFSNYFKPVDLIAELKKVKTEGTNFYEFYRSVQKALNTAKDGHFYFDFPGNKDFDNKLVDFYAILPLKLSIDINNDNEPGMKGVPLADFFYNQYPNGLAIKEVIERNKNNFITSINGISPIDFVLNFGSDHYNYLKNEDARYTYASDVLSGKRMLHYLPLLEEDFSDLTVIYSNGESFRTNFYFENINPVSTTNRRDVSNLKEFAREMLKNHDERKVIDLDDIIKAYNSGEKPWAKKTLTEKEAIQTLKNLDFEKIIQEAIEMKNASKKVLGNRANTMTWDYSTPDAILKCRTDLENKVNVFYLNSFSTDYSNEFVVVLGYCRTAFDMNEYPIVVINDYNNGGLIDLALIFQEILQPDMTARTFISYKNDERVGKRMQSAIEAGFFQNPETGETITTFEELMEGAEVDNFGNGVSHSRSKPALFLYSDVRVTLDKVVRPIYKRNKKPTEIIVFTDSYSFSAGAIFTKGLKEAGAAILVGYNGYPGSKKETFDIGQAPTNNYRKKLDLLGKDEYNRLNEKGIVYRSISAGETYRLSDVENGVKPLVPREFLFDAPDERVAIYSAYSDDKYDIFMDAAKSVLEKYKTECNPDNLGLHMRNSECDEKINKTHMHGGYVCGADGKWSTKCEGYYCDDGYYFDTKTKECVVDLFYSLGDSSLSSMDSSSSMTISLWALLFVLIFILF